MQDGVAGFFARRGAGRRGGLLLAASVAALSGGVAVPGLALAQDAGQSAGAVLSEVIVTATRKDEALDKVAASITAIGDDALGAGGVKDIASLATAVPNLSVGDQFGVNRTFIRGIGMTSIDLGADGAVAFLQDGAIVSRPAAQLSGFYDVERVEVLRGPQGTLYGRGATAGAINLVTKKPSREMEGYGDLTLGNYDARSFEGAVSGPLVEDKVLFRLAGKYDRRDGYGTNLFTGADVDDRNAYALRASVMFLPTDQLSLLVSGETYREKDNNYAFHYFGPTVAPENALGSILGGDTIITLAGKRGVEPDLRDIYSDQDAINRRRGSSVTATLEWNGGDLNLKSVTSYRRFRRLNVNDLDASNVWMFGQNNYDERSTTFGQEFVATYSAERFEVLAGAMYFHEKNFGSVRVPLINLGLLFGVPANTFNDLNYLQIGTVKTDAYGAFAQVTYSLSDRLKVTAGGRFSHEKRDGTGRFEFLTSTPTDKAKSWDAFTPTLSINFQAAEDTLLYGSVTRGFKSGVINVGSQNPVIDPEYAWGYEAGVKTSAFDRRLSAALALFYIDYSDLQVGFVGADSVVTTVNAASARNYGAELELRGAPLPGLELNLFATYLNAKYTDFVSGDYRQGFAQVDLSGNRLSNAPEYSVRLGARYELPLNSDWGVALRGDVSWQGRVYFTEFNNADATQGAYALVNAGVEITDPSGRWSLDVWGRNLTDEFIISNNIITAPLFSSVRVGSLAPPRTYGVTLGYRF